MSCACEHKKLGSDYERIAGLAKKFAVMEGETVAIYQNEDGTYGFCLLGTEINKPIIEYKSPI